MDARDLAKRLIRHETVSPVTSRDPFGPVVDLLNSVGIDFEFHEFGDVVNLTAEFGSGPPTVCFNGHIDVVAPGERWSVTDPFDPVVEDGRLYGRGASDMKAAMASEICAFVDLFSSETFDGRAVLMVVGDEEIGGDNGTERLVARYPDVEYAIVGEPTNLDVQVGTRGTLWIDVYLNGESIHVARADKPPNVVDDLSGVLETLQGIDLDYEKDDILPDVGYEVTIVRTDDTQNSLPGSVRIGLDVRYLPSQSVDGIIEQVKDALDGLGVEYTLDHVDHGGPYKLTDDRLKLAVTEAITAVQGTPPQYITEGGASDGRFFAMQNVPFVELGVDMATAHKADEHCPVEQIDLLHEVYVDVAERLCE